MPRLAHNRYGKARVRLFKIHRHEQGCHEVCELEADVLLKGDLDDAYLSDDNSKVVPTDTVKNTVHFLAHDHLEGCRTRFALVIGRHFLEKYFHLDGVEIELRERSWRRMEIAGEPHPHSFEHDANGVRFTRALFTRGAAPVLSSGIRGRLILKSTGSGFSGYPVCDLTTLPPTDDRIFSTRVTAEWHYADAAADVDYAACERAIFTATDRVFAERFSPSVQRTLFEMAEAALEAVPEISRMSLALPNVHFLNLDLSRLGRPDQNAVFLPTDEPHGQIEATVTRD